MPRHAILTLITILLLAGCGTADEGVAEVPAVTVTPHSLEGDTDWPTPTPPPPPMIVPTAPALDAKATALLDGYVHIIDDCVYVGPEPNEAGGFLVVWPNGSSLLRIGKDITLLDEQDRPVLRFREGDRLSMAGGGLVEPDSPDQGCPVLDGVWDIKLLDQAPATPAPTGPFDSVADFAEAFDLSTEEARVRLGHQDVIGQLQAFAAQDPTNFASLRVEHHPDYRIVIQVKPDGAARIREYVTELRLPVRVDFDMIPRSEVELVAQSNAVTEIAGAEGISFSSAIHGQTISLYGATPSDVRALQRLLALGRFPENVEVWSEPVRVCLGTEACDLPIAMPTASPAPGECDDLDGVNGMGPIGLQPGFSTVHELVWTAGTIVVGTVTEVLPTEIVKLDDAMTPAVMVSDVIVTVEQQYRGDLTEQVRVRRLGGKVGNCASMYPPDIDFFVGDRVVLFVTPPDGRYEIPAQFPVGGPQGVWFIKPDGSIPTTLPYAGELEFATLEEMNAAIVDAYRQGRGDAPLHSMLIPESESPFTIDADGRPAKP